jgi:hypothetical protein
VEILEKGDATQVEDVLCMTQGELKLGLAAIHGCVSSLGKKLKFVTTTALQRNKPHNPTSENEVLQILFQLRSLE